MDEKGSYGQFCPVAMASEVLCTRWTTLVLREMLCGSTRFNDIRRGVPRMSPTLLSKRLKELEAAGVVRTAPGPGGALEYRLTEAGEDLRGVITGIGVWGQRWFEANLSLKNLDPSLLMWDIRRNLDPRPLPPRRVTVHFCYPELAEARGRWWLVIDAGTVDLCAFDPGFEVDLTITTSLRTMTAVWMGLAQVGAEVRAGRLQLDGDRDLARAAQRWLGLSVFAPVERRAS